MRISVVGGGEATDDTMELAEAVGRRVGEGGHTLVCGGLGGVMAAGSRGAKAAGGRTIGILPGREIEAANEHVDVPIATGLGNGRNVLVAANGDGAIAIDGRYGTLSEIAHALDLGRPVAGLETHDVAGVEHVRSADEALTYLERAAGP